MSRLNQPIRVEPTPIKGTLMHRRHQGRAEVGPEYRGSSLDSAKRDAETLGVNSFGWQGETYILSEGKWYKLVLS